MWPDIPEDLILESVKRRLSAATNTNNIFISPFEIPILLNAISEYQKVKALAQYLDSVEISQHPKH
jgi:hypothetical protein